MTGTGPVSLQATQKRDVTRERFHAGDPLRGACALSVFAVHAFVGSLAGGKSGAFVPGRLGDAFRLQFGPFGSVLIMAQYGVWVFLALSGYLISRPFVRAYLRKTPMPPIGDYLRARVLRIVPAFWVAAFATLVVFGASETSLGRILAVFGFLGVYYPSYFFGRIIQGWTITNEAAFYLALPLLMLALAFVSRRLRLAATRAAALAVVLALVVLGSLLVALSNPATLGGGLGPETLAYAFVPGVVLAMLEHWLPQRVAGRRPWVLLAPALIGVGLVGTFVFANLQTGGQLVSALGVLPRTLGSLFASLVLYGCVLAQWAGSRRWRVLDNRLFRYLGERSYSIYLVHLGVILLLREDFGPTQHAWHRAAYFVPLTLGLSIPLGELLHRTVERPAMRFAARRRAQERVQAATILPERRGQGQPPTWALPGGLVLVTSLLVGGFTLLASAVVLAHGQTNNIEWVLYFLTLMVLAPSAVVVGRLLARKIGAVAGREAVAALAAISAAGILGVLIASRAAYALGHRTSPPMLVLALVWSVIVAIAARRSLRGKTIGELLLRRRIGALSPWMFGVGLLCVASLAFFPAQFFHPGQVLVSLIVAAALVVAHERWRATVPTWAGRLLDVGVVVLLIMIVTDVSGYQEYLRPDARTFIMRADIRLTPDVLAFIQRFHEDLWLGPLNDMLHGRTLLVDTTSQYGAGVMYFLAGYFQVAPLGYGALGLLTGFLTGLQVALAYAVLRLAGARRMLAIPAITAVVLGLVMGVPGSFNDYPSIGALRFGIPWAVVLLTLLAALRPQRHRMLWIAAGAVVAFTAVWSFETFAYAAAAFTTAAAFDAARTHRARRWIAVVLRRIVYVAALSVALYVLLAVATRIFSGSWPEPSGYLAYLSFYSSGASELYGVTSPWPPGLPMLLVHLASLLCLGALVARRHKIVDEHHPALATIAATSGLGIISFSYWVGNSAHETLFFMGLPVVVVATLWLSIVTAERERMPAGFRVVPLAAGVWFAVTLGISGWQDTEGKWRRTALAHALPFGGAGSSLPDAVPKLWNNPASDRRALAAQALLDRHLPPGAPALVIMEPELAVETLVRSGRTNVLPISNPEQDNLVPDHIDPRVIATVDALRPGMLMLTQPATWNTPVKTPGGTYAPNELVRVQRLALDRIRSRFRLEVVERVPEGLAIVRLRPRG